MFNELITYGSRILILSSALTHVYILRFLYPFLVFGRFECTSLETNISSHEKGFLIIFLKAATFAKTYDYKSNIGPC